MKPETSPKKEEKKRQGFGVSDLDQDSEEKSMTTNRKF